jgi:hypothetical protein
VSARLSLGGRGRRGALGAALVAVAVTGNVMLISSASATSAVLQVTRDIPAGSVVTADDLRLVEVGALDPSVRVVHAVDHSMVIGRHAKTRLVAGTLVVHDVLQPEPLVAPGSAVVAISVADLPGGLRERSRVDVVLPPDPFAASPAPSELIPIGDPDTAGAVIVPGIVVGLPGDTTSVTGESSVSVEVAHTDAHLVATHDDPRLVLLAPEAP